MLPSIAAHYPKPQDMNGRPHNFIDNQEMMEFYKNQMNRVNGTISMLPNNDYGPNIGIGGHPMVGSNL